MKSHNNSDLGSIQIRNAVSTILANQNNSNKAAQELLDQQKLWQQTDFAKLFKFSRTQRISDTTNFFYEYFKSNHGLDIMSLRSDAPFAKNMIEHSNSGNIAGCQKSIQLYCDYLALLSTNPTEVQQSYLNSFPPKNSQDIQCPGGTGARLEELNQNLKIPKEDRHLLEIHQLLISKLINKLKYHVSEPHQVHLLPYLNYAVGVESKAEVETRDITFITPQFDIPAYILQQDLTGYASNFSLELQKRSDYLRNSILGICDKFSANLPFSIDAVNLDQMNKEFLALGISTDDYRNFIKEKDTTAETKSAEESKNNEIDDDYEWDSSAIDTFAHKDLRTRLLSYNSAENSAQTPSTALETPCGSDLFRTTTPAKIAALLRSENNEELLAGVESLWTLGIRLAGNSPIQLIETVKVVSVEFLTETVQPRLPLSQQFKIGSILDNYDLCSTYPHINACFSDNPSIKDLLLGGAAYETLVKNFADKNETNHTKFYAEIAELGEPECRQLMSRPDRVEIVEELKKFAILLPENVSVKLLEMAAKSNDLAMCRDQFLQNSEPTPRLFSTGQALVSAIQNSNPEMTKLFLEKGATVAIADEKGLYPIHHAAITGIKEIVTLLRNYGADLNKTCANSKLTAAHLASAQGKTSSLEALKEHGADLDKPTVHLRLDPIHKIGAYIKRPIHYAISNQQNDAVITLIKLGVRVRKYSYDDPQPDGDLFDPTEPKILPLISKYNLPEAFKHCFAKLKSEELETIDHAFQLGEPHRFENVQNSLNKAAVKAAAKNYPEMLTATLECGATTPSSNTATSNEIKKIIDDHQVFDAAARAIFSAVAKHLPRLSKEGAKELLTLEGEIRTTLIKTHSFDPQKLSETLHLEQDNSTKVSLLSEQKYRIKPNATIEQLGQEISQKLTHHPHQYSVYLPLTYSDVFIPKYNRAAIMTAVQNRTAPQAHIQNATSSTLAEHANLTQL